MKTYSGYISIFSFFTNKFGAYSQALKITGSLRRQSKLISKFREYIECEVLDGMVNTKPVMGPCGEIQLGRAN